MIRIQELAKHYGSVRVLENITMEIARGEIFAIVGHSGAGKSTLLRCINGLEEYSAGSLSIDGQEVGALNGDQLRALRKRAGMIFQNFSLMQRKTVYDNIALPMQVWKYPESRISQRVDELLDLVGLADKRSAYPGELSGGQKQRVAIARALTLEPDILLSDEATSALDPNTTNSILQLLNEINRAFGITVVLVTHEMNVVKAIAHRAALLQAGKIVAMGDVEKLFLVPTPQMRSFLGEDEILPDTGVNVRLFFPSDTVSVSFIAAMARNVNVDFSIAWGRLEKIRDGVIGNLVINLKEEEYPLIAAYLDSQSIQWEVL